MWPDRVSNPGPLRHQSGALPTALCGPARDWNAFIICTIVDKRQDETFSKTGTLVHRPSCKLPT